MRRWWLVPLLVVVLLGAGVQLARAQSVPLLWSWSDGVGCGAACDGDYMSSLSLVDGQMACLDGGSAYVGELSLVWGGDAGVFYGELLAVPYDAYGVPSSPRSTSSADGVKVRAVWQYLGDVTCVEFDTTGTDFAELYELQFMADASSMPLGGASWDMVDRQVADLLGSGVVSGAIYATLAVVIGGGAIGVVRQILPRWRGRGVSPVESRPLVRRERGDVD